MNEAADNPDSHQQSRGSRHRHRQISHETAHAEANAAGPHSAGGDGHHFKHPLVCTHTAEMISTPPALAQLLSVCREARAFAFDTEFIGEQSYIPRLCLIQIGLADRVALIDPMSGLDVRPFWELVADSSVEKIVHAGQQDVEPVFRLTGKPAANVFDAQVAAGFVGLPYPLSLSKLIGETVGARLGKGLTFTSWDQRPLSSQQMRYAADDVRYLPAARKDLQKRLITAGHDKWAAEESAELCRTATRRFDPDEGYLKIRGAGTLEPSGLAVLRELSRWRDEGAREADLPPRTFLRDEVLLGLARSPCKSLEKLERLRGLPRPVEAKHGARIVELTLGALALPRSEWPDARHEEPPPREKFLCDGFWAAAQSACFERGIDPALAASRQDIGALWRLVRSGADATECRLMNGWRRAAIGDRLVELIRAV